MKLFSPESLAKELGISEHTLANWRSAGRRPAYAKLGGKIRYRESDIANWIESNLRSSTMPIRNRHGIWHYRFWLDGREYTGSTDLVATERNRNAATRAEAKARELVVSGRSHELRLQVKPFSDAAADFLLWADGEYTEHPNTAKRLHTSFVSLLRFFRNAPVSSILRGQ